MAPSTAERLLDQYCAGPRSSSFTALQRRILLATALEDAFAAFEQRAGQSVTIEQSVPATAEFKLSVALLGPDFKGYAEIWLPLDAVPALLPRHTSTGEDHDAWVDHIPFTIRRCAGFQRVSWSDLRDLRPGDTVMCEAAEEPRQFAIIGDQMIANLGRDGALVTRWRALSKYGSRDMEPFNKHASDQPMQDGSLADLPVRLTFEVGRTEISLRELRQFDQGSILPVAATIEDCVEIVANGRLIGRGSLLKIGSGLGVRIVQLVPHV
nr:type III secretion system cytoplasmic ring protein SctQ [Ensifer sp. ENS02]